MLLNKRISIWYFINEIKYQILLIVVFALTIGLHDSYLIFRKISVPIGVATIIGATVSLLLAFRTSQSYERWWEARTVWGAIVNDSRTLVRQIIQFMPAGHEEAVREFARRQIIWTYALGESLRRIPLSSEVQMYLDNHDIKAVNLPNALLDAHSLQLKKLAEDNVITEFKQVQLNDTIARLCDSMGKCERIKNTIFPRSYSLLVHTLIYVFAFVLPFGLGDAQLFVEVGASVLIPILFIAIEKTAILMQDPFENTPVDTPMTSLAKTIEINILQTIREKEVPVKEVTKLYYEM